MSGLPVGGFDFLQKTGNVTQKRRQDGQSIPDAAGASG
jgi:hypothetical protein